jgi:hypothetical protein
VRRTIGGVEEEEAEGAGEWVPAPLRVVIGGGEGRRTASYVCLRCVDIG